MHSFMRLNMLYVDLTSYSQEELELQSNIQLMYNVALEHDVCYIINSDIKFYLPSVDYRLTTPHELLMNDINSYEEKLLHAGKASYHNAKGLSYSTAKESSSIINGLNKLRQYKYVSSHDNRISSIYAAGSTHHNTHSSCHSVSRSHNIVNNVTSSRDIIAGEITKNITKRITEVNNDEYMSPEDINNDMEDIDDTKTQSRIITQEKVTVTEDNIHAYIKLCLQRLKFKNDLPTTLTPQQYLACNFFLVFDGISKFMFNHGTGVGKTVEGSYITHKFLQISRNSRVIILVLKVTQQQWITQLQKDDIYRQLDNVDIVPYDTSTFSNNISLAKSKLRATQRVLIIIDEIHIMISRSLDKNSITRPMKVQLDDLLSLSSKRDNKLLLLTGTPFINNIREFDMYINILRPTFLKEVQPQDIITSNSINRISEITKGMMYSSSSINSQTRFAFSNTPRSDNYAAKTIVFKRIQMHSYQEELYKSAQEIERKSLAGGFKFLTRNYGNFAYKFFIKENMSEEEYITKREESIEEFKSIMKSSIDIKEKEELMEQCSRQLKDIVDHIQSEKDKKYKCVIYANMYEIIDALKSYLDVRNISYMEFSGRTIKDRQSDLQVYNSTANLYGEQIKVLILSAAGSIGINIYAVRRFYFLSQEWNDSTAQQVIGRCLRYRYHIDFPVEEQELIIYLYFSVTQDSSNTDDTMFSLVRSKFNILSQALEIIISSSLETYQSLIQDAVKSDDKNDDKTSIDVVSVLPLVNNYLKNITNFTLPKMSYATTTKVKKIAFKKDGVVYNGYIKENKLFDEVDNYVTDLSNTRLTVYDGMLIYDINNE